MVTPSEILFSQSLHLKSKEEIKEASEGAQGRVLIMAKPYYGNGDVESATKLAIKFAKTNRFKVALWIDLSGAFTTNTTITRKQLENRLKPYSKTLSLISGDDKEITAFDPEVLISVVAGDPEPIIKLLEGKALKQCYFLTEYNGDHYGSSRYCETEDETYDKGVYYARFRSGIKKQGVLTISEDEIKTIPKIQEYDFPLDAKISDPIQKLIKLGEYYFGYASSHLGTDRGKTKLEYMLSVLEYAKSVSDLQSKDIVFIFPGNLSACDAPIRRIVSQAQSLTLYSLTNTSFTFLEYDKESEPDEYQKSLNKFPYCYPGANSDGPRIHIITGSLEHALFLMFMKNSQAPFVLATGDQSAVEAWILGFFVFYEAMSHKGEFYKAFQECFTSSDLLDAVAKAKIPSASNVSVRTKIMIALKDSEFLMEYTKRLKQIITDNDLFESFQRKITQFALLDAKVKSVGFRPENK